MKKEYLIIGGVVIVLFLGLLIIPCKSPHLSEQEIGQLQKDLQSVDVASTDTSAECPAKKFLCKRPVVYGFGANKPAELVIRTVERPDLCFYGGQDNWVKVKEVEGVYEVVVKVPKRAKPCVYHFQAQFVVDDAEYGP